jgi:hypothetical protein
VTDGTILNVRVYADAHVMNVTADDAVVPDARMIAYFHIADDLRSLGNVDPLAQLRPFPFVFMQHGFASAIREK